MVTRILIAAIPVAVMLFIEVVLPRLKTRWERVREQPEVLPSGEVGSPEGANAAAGSPQDGSVRSESRGRQNVHYYQILHRTAASGNIASMDKLGEFALVRKDLIEAFYWKLMVELHGGRPSGLPVRNVCRVWADAGCPEGTVGDGSGLFTEEQKRFALAVLNLWSGLHVHTPTEDFRQMVADGHADAILFERKFGFEVV